MFGVCNALLLSMSIGTPILTSGSFTQKQAEPIKNMCLYDSKNNICKRYSDVDHDGICDNWLLFTHKLDTCCQAMCQEHKTAKNPAFRRRRIINRLDSVTVCTVGVNNNNRPLCKLQTYIKTLLFNYVQIGNYTDLHRIHWLPIMHDGFLVQ